MEFEEIDYWRAATNWVAWERDYNEPVVAIPPVLQEQDRFAGFIKEYGLLRGIAGNQRPGIRVWLRDNLNFDTPITELAEKLQDEVQLPSRQISLISKILCFAAPENFFPKDQYSTRGLRHEDHGPANPTYEDYHIRCNDLFNQNNDNIEAFLHDRVIPTDNIDGFNRRVFDTALMRIGGRWG